MASPNLPRFRLLTPAELDALPEPTWLIDGILPSNAFCVLYGEPGCGKTFVALSFALSIASGKNWCGKDTRAGSVLYVAAEGLYGLKLRVKAWEIKHDTKAGKIQFLNSGFNLLQSDDVDEVAGLIDSAKPAVIVLDTLARMTVGGDENNAKDMGRAISAIDGLRQKTFATAILIHHTRKDGRTERGSTALRGAADVMIECSESMKVISLKCDKMKDAAEFKDISLGMETVPLSEKTSSLVVTPLSAALKAADEKWSAGTALEILRDFGPDGATNTDWRKAYGEKTQKSKSTFDRAFRDLKDSGAIRSDGKRYYLTAPDVGVSVNEVSSSVVTPAA